MTANYKDLAIDPEEAADLRRHVGNCIKRHTALVDLIHRHERMMIKTEIINWVYRVFMLPAVIFIIVKMWNW